MVYCGKPSKSCHACRKRKTRCDAKPNGCSQCARTGRTCPGYRAQVDLIFKDQSDNVVRKAKARAAKASTKAPTQPSTENPFEKDLFDDSPIDDIIERDSRELQVAIVEPQAVEQIFSLGPTVEDRATCFFIAHYATGVVLPGYNDLHQSDTFQLSTIMDPTLSASVRATSLASFAHYMRSSELSNLSRYHYTKAIQMTNSALACPEDARRDSTLLSTILLGLYEMLTGTNQKSMKDWTQHVHGAAALLRLRGSEQFHSSFTRRMFLQATTGVLASCMQRCMRLPGHIVDMLEKLSVIMGGLGEFGRLGVSIVQIMVEFNQIRCDIHEGILSDQNIILAYTKDIDQRLVELSNNHPREWRFDVIDGHTENQDIVFRGCYHVYGDVWVANAWNSIRMFRILINQYTRDALLKGFSSNPPIFTGPEHTEQFQRSTDVCYTMQSLILASVPQSLGYVRNNGLASPGLPSNRDILRYEDMKFSHEIYDTPAGLASSGYNLLWPLWYSGFMELATEDASMYCADCLEKIGNDMGIAQAFILAQTIRTKTEPNVWSQDFG